MRTVLLSSVLALVSATTSASEAQAATDLTFPFDDARLLQPEEREGGLVHVGRKIDEPRGLLVFLHGINERGPLHRGLGAGGYDLRSIVDDLVDADRMRPVLVAGPSQTRDAWTGSKLWGDFDLDAFVEATEAASGAKIDRSHVVLVGHSGAGCNATGGLLAPLGSVRPLATVAVDVCMDDRFGRLLAERAALSPVHVLYQDAIWPREIAAFKAAFEATLAADPSRTATLTRYDAPGANPHDEVVKVGLRDVLPRLLPPPDDAHDDHDAHDAT